MKKIMFCGLAFLALSLVNCGGDKDDPKKDCDKKKDTHVWNEENKSCDPKPADSLSQADCNKDLTKKWDPKAKEGKGECKDLTEDECALIAEVQWDKAQKKCVLKSEEEGGQYTVTLKSQLGASTKVNQVKLEIESQNKSASLLGLNDCVRLKVGDFELLKISTFATGKEIKNLCGGTNPDEDGAPIQENKCGIGHYSVLFDTAGNLSLRPETSANANIDKCKKLQDNTVSPF